MSSRIWGLYPTRDQFIPINLFGYTTKGIPGLEVVGLKSYSRSIKEKFIYLTRQQQDQIPLRRYVICTESSGQLLLDEQNYRWLELPMLILFWSLAGYLPIQRLDDCLSLGRVSVTGEIES
ncbi:MAG: hypothetical protein HOM21_06425, partial [Halobacteriovoraceae bacterium]|nr:hypothetical protein [Halobacteriovoraceae bacterium]